MPSSSILIAGAGIFGLTAAWELRRRGWQVTVIDPGPVPRPTAATTDVSKVIRMDYGGDELYTAMGEAAMTGWDDWNHRWTPPLYHEDGFLLLAGEPMTPGGFEYESYALLKRRGHPVERLTAIDRATAFPEWSAEHYPDGYISHRAGWAESGKVLARIAGEVRTAGVTLIEGTSFHRLVQSRGRTTGLRTTSGDTHSADVILVAAGAWTPALLPHLHAVMWATGQPVVHVEAGQNPRWRPPAFPVWAADISRTGWYGFPAMADGALKIGHHGVGRRVDPEARREVLGSEIDRVRQFLRYNLPALADAPVVETRLCLYCDTFDGDFWIDHDPDRPGLVVAAGDSGHGFKFAPVLGPLIADIVERKPNEWAGRFAWRARVEDGKEAARSVSS